MTTFNWTIAAMDCHPTAQGQSNVVFNVHWRCGATDGEHNADVYGTCGVKFTGGTYTPYDQLTQEQVIGWVWANGVSKEEIETSLTRQIEALVNPKQVTLPVPWSQ